jgi:hypothetical protein
VLVIEGLGVPAHDSVCLVHAGVQLFEHGLLTVVVHLFEDNFLLTVPPSAKAHDFR